MKDYSEFSPEEQDKYSKIAGITTLGIGAPSYLLGKYVESYETNPEILKHAKRTKSIGLASAIGGAGILGYRKYKHHKEREGKG